MNAALRPWRSVLYIPGDNARALDKARRLGCDAVILDLEDAVPPARKRPAREALGAELARGGFGPRARIVRINALDTPWGAGDIAALNGMYLDGVLLPKVAASTDIDVLARRLPGVPLWAMIESPAGVLNAPAIAAHPRLAGLVMGTNDLAKDLGCDPGADRAPLQAALQMTVLAARARGRVCIDGVCNAFRDEGALRAEAAQGAALGFDGKTLIHPAQIAGANAAFAPDAAALDLARRQIAAHEAAVAEDAGVAVVDGKIVENLHIVAAKRLLARAAAIEALEAS